MARTRRREAESQLRAKQIYEVIIVLIIFKIFRKCIEHYLIPGRI